MIALSAGISAMLFFERLEIAAAYWIIATTLVIPCFLAQGALDRRGAIITAFLIGSGYSMLWGLWGVSHQLPVNLEGETLTIQGQISGPVRRNSQGIHFPLNVWSTRGVDGSLIQHRLRRVQLGWRQTIEMPTTASCWQFTIRLKKPRSFASPGAYDYSARLFRRSIDAKGYVILDELAHKLTSKRCSSVLLQLQSSLHQQILFAFHPDYQATALALLVGDGSHFTSMQWENLRLSGTVHLMIVSGLHIGLFAGLGFIIFGGLARHLGIAEKIPSYPAGALGALLFALFYYVSSGMQLPALRALVMIAVPILCSFVGRKPNSYSVWLLALVIVLILDPMAPTSSGFWYSFLAVAVLLLIFNNRPQQSGKFVKLIKAQLGIFLLVAFLGLMAGLPVNPAAFAVNIVAIFIVGVLLVPLLMFALCCAYILPAVTSFIMPSLEFLLDLLWFLIDSAAGFEWPLYLDPTPVDATIFGLVAIFLILLPVVTQVRSAMLVLFSLMLFGRSSQSTELRMILLDVGQGLSVVVETSKHRLIFDTGMIFSEDFSAAQSVIEPYLRRQHETRIDHLIISHADLDHRGGYPYLASRFAIGRISVGGNAELLDIIPGSLPCRVGDKWQWDNVRFSVLWGYSAQHTGNDGSCVLLIQNGNQSILLTGDISAKTERLLLQGALAGVQEPISLLVVPHHGSKSSSSWPFVKQLNARYAVASVGYRNRFSHPSPQVIKRYQQVGGTFLDTSKSGTLTFSLGANGQLELESEYRFANHRYWW